MLHEILLSLSGHPSPLLRNEQLDAKSASVITPSERQLLSTIARLSDIHLKLIPSTSRIAESHPSILCRAAAAAISSKHLRAFQRKILEVEESIIKGDPDYVGAYNIVPLTAIVGQFKPWLRSFEWLYSTVQFMVGKHVAGERNRPCQGAELMTYLRREMLSGHRDVADLATSLNVVAETAWLKQVSAWILYGKLPTFGAEDFCVQKIEGSDEDFECDSNLLPPFVTSKTGLSMLFIGRSLNHPQVRSSVEAGFNGLDNISSKVHLLSSLTLPLDQAAFARAIKSIRLSLSETTLQRILPLPKILEMIRLLREFFLLGRGEFAVALTHEADEKMRSRWQRADKLAYEKGDGFKNIVIKEGEAAAVLSRTWTVLTSMQGQHTDDDEELELGRDLLRLQLINTKGPLPLQTIDSGLSKKAIKRVTALPFPDLLLGTPALLGIQLPSPLDMIVSQADIHLYSIINSYLLSMRRAHIRLTGIWKITSLRRHHPAISGASEHAVMLRKRWSERSLIMRNSWTTASAAIFFLGETEGYLQTEIVMGLWNGFQSWLFRHETGPKSDSRPGTSGTTVRSASSLNKYPGHGEMEDDEDDLWMNESKQPTCPTASKPSFSQDSKPFHDTQAISNAHALYLRTLTHRLLLTQPTFTAPLYTLLTHIDHLVGHIHRLNSIFTTIDLETDSGIVEAYIDLEVEEEHVIRLLRSVEEKVRQDIEDVVAALRQLEEDAEFEAMWEGGRDGTGADDDDEADGWDVEEEEAGRRYMPAKVGGIDRLLMKLDFGSWLGANGTTSDS